MATLTGEAGEHFVLAEMLRRGWIAGQTPRGFRSYDLLAHRRIPPVSLLVRVKTSRNGRFQWNARWQNDECLQIFSDLDQNNPRDITVLVWMPEAGHPAPTYSLFKTQDLEPQLQRTHWAYYEAKGQRPSTYVVMRHDQLDDVRGWDLLDELANG
jgi:hypothetical protein